MDTYNPSYAYQHGESNSQSTFDALFAVAATPEQPAVPSQPKDDLSVVSHNIRRDAEGALNMGTEIIIIHVGDGDEQKEFVVHKNLLIKHSEYFQTMFRTDNWEEAKRGEVELETDDPEAFELFHQFVYTGCVFSQKQGDTARAVDEVNRTEEAGAAAGSADQSDRDSEMGRLCRAWELGQKLMSTSFKDAITDTMRSKVRAGEIPMHANAWIYPRSPENAAMRRLLVDIAVWYWNSPAFLEQKQYSERYHEYFYDIAVASDKLHLLRMQNASQHPISPIENGHSCFYHEHETDSTVCYRKMF